MHGSLYSTYLVNVGIPLVPGGTLTPQSRRIRLTRQNGAAPPCQVYLECSSVNASGDGGRAHGRYLR